MKKMGLDFQVVPAHIDEHHDGLLRPHAIARSIAKRKAEVVARQHPEEWVLGCDTIVCLADGRITLKPKDRMDARRTLKAYEGSYCDVYSGLALIHRGSGVCRTGFKRTRIYFHEFGDEALEAYLDTGEWEGRSGAMTIEGKGDWVHHMEGEYWNVVGLPVDLLKKFLKASHLV